MYPKVMMEKRPFLQYMCDYYFKKQIHPQFRNFCQLIYFIHQRSYKIIRKFLPILPGSMIRSETQLVRKMLKNNLLDINQIPTMLNDLYGDVENMHVTIGGDAASIKPVSEKGNSAVYTFMILPIKKIYKTFPLHMTITQNGASNKEIVNKFFKICDIVERCKVSVDFVATDGDEAFDFIHYDFFLKVNEIMQKDIPFIEKINLIKRYKRIPSNDFLHLLKNGRSHLLNHLLLLDPITMKCVNMELFRIAAKLGDVIDDKSNVGAMKDSYALALFSWETFTKLISEFRFDGAFYVLPFLYMLLATRSKTLCREERLKLLDLSIKIFYFHLGSILNSKPEDFFTPKYKETSIGTLFGDEIFVI